MAMFNSYVTNYQRIFLLISDDTATIHGPSARQNRFGNSEIKKPGALLGSSGVPLGTKRRNATTGTTNKLNSARTVQIYALLCVYVCVITKNNCKITTQCSPI